MSGKEVIVPDGLVIVSRADLSGNIIAFNQGLPLVSGYSTDELLGKAHSLLRHPDTPKALFDDMWHTLKAGLPWFGVIKNLCKNGDFYWVAANVVPIVEEGKITAYLSVRYPASREQIAQAEQLYGSIRLGTSQFPNTKTTTMVTPAILSLIIGTLVAIGTVLYSVLVGADHPLIMGSLVVTFVVLLGYGTQQLWKLIMPSAELRAGVEAMSNGQLRQPILDNTPTAMLLNTVRARLAELDARVYDAHQQAEALQAKLHKDRAFTISKMAQSMAHEINNPIAGIMMHLIYLSEITSKNDLKEVVDETLNEVKRVSKLIKAMLGFNRRLVSNYQYCQLDEAFNQVILKVQDLLKQKNITLVTSLEALRGAQVLSSPDSIKQIILNLINHAVRTMESVTERSITLDASLLTASDTPLKLLVRVTYTGAGLPEALKQKIFDPFFTTKPADQDSELLISMTLAEDMGVIFALDETYTQGVRFLLYLPMSKETTA